MDKKYFIIGSPGWLGTQFVKVISGSIAELNKLSLIHNAIEIRCLVHPNVNSEVLRRIHPKITTVSGDITQKETLADFFRDSEGGILFHFAGIIHPFDGIKQIYQVNVDGTNNILDEAIRHNMKRIVAISSNSPIGCNPNADHFFTEESPYKPYMAYGRSKMLMEQLINDAQQKQNIEAVILRPCWFYGVGQPVRQTLFFSMIKNGKALIVGTGNNKRSMSYIDNTCQAILLASQSPKANGQTYWIADKSPYSMNEIINTVEDLLEHEFNIPVAHKRIKLPAIASEVAYGIDRMLQVLGIYHQKIHVLSEMNKTIACSIEKAERDLDYHPPIDLREGMRRSIQWCIDHHQAI